MLHVKPVAAIVEKWQLNDMLRRRRATTQRQPQRMDGILFFHYGNAIDLIFQMCERASECLMQSKAQ